ncbi:hypothetical protein Dimus_011299 [Dionaea muscipula]
MDPVNIVPKIRPTLVFMKHHPPLLSSPLPVPSLPATPTNSILCPTGHSLTLSPASSFLVSSSSSSLSLSLLIFVLCWAQKSDLSLSVCLPAPTKSPTQFHHLLWFFGQHLATSCCVIAGVIGHGANQS